MPIFKSENQLIKKFIVPQLKSAEYVVKKLIKIKQCLQKLKSEEVVSKEEIDIKHPGHPDIDIVFWKPEEPPVIQAAEVKYFRLTKRGLQPKAFYDGLHEAEILLTYGFDYVYLWHFYDFDVTQDLREYGPKVINDLVVNTYLPINYKNWKIIRPPKPLDEIKDLKEVLLWLASEITSFNVFGIYPYTRDLRRNSLMSLGDVQKRRKILRKALRIV